MRFKTFRTAVLGGAVALGAVGVYWALHRTPSPAPVPPPSLTAPPPRPAPAPATTAPTRAPAPDRQPDPPAAPTAGANGLRPVDQDILALVRAGIKGDKLTDAFPKKAYKVNLYRDGGDAGVSRLKVDLDRDGKWDEKWAFGEGGRVKRQVAPADDESYSETYLLDGSDWKRKD
jgi:hypothetical protein